MAVAPSIDFPYSASIPVITSSEDSEFFVSSATPLNAADTFSMTPLSISKPISAIPEKSASFNPFLILSLRASTAAAASFPSFLNL